jgi:hypothetical protein
MKQHDRIIAEVDALKVGDSVTFKDYSEYFAVEEAMKRFTDKEFLYKINDQFQLIRVS